MTLQKLPLELLETVAGFCGDVASVAPDEQTSTFTNAIVNPYLDSATSNTSSWSPAYRDLRALALVSKIFSNPAQRALFKFAMVKTTGHLMRLLRSLLLYPYNRPHVRCFVAVLQDHPRSLAYQFAPPTLVLAEFIFYLMPLFAIDAAKELPNESFFRRTIPLLQGTLHRLANSNLTFTVPLIDSTPINLHTMEDQLLTATVQLCPNLAATRISFGSPQRYPPQEARQPIQEPSVYVSLVEDHSSKLTSLSLDFGALLWQTNLQDYVPGYPAGLTPLRRTSHIGWQRAGTASESVLRPEDPYQLAKHQQPPA